MKITFLALLLCSCIMTMAQVNCATLEINKVPGKWVWQRAGYGAQWQYGDPLRKEMQRIMPVALDGLHATSSIAFGDQATFWYTKSPAAYEYYLMLKKYECLKGYNTLQQEGETSCWVHFSVNQLDGEKFPMPEQGTGVIFNESRIRVTNIEVQTDAAGNKVIYSNYRPDETIKHCYFFSSRKNLPWRKLNNKELFTAYKAHHETRVIKEIARFEKLVSDDEKKFNSLSSAKKQQQTYWPEIIRKNKEILQRYKDEHKKIITWYTAALKQPDLQSTAYVISINESHFYPDKLTASPGHGYYAWVDNLDFFDKTKPKDEPQCIALYPRKQDTDIPKKNFMELFYSQFNLDVLGRMVGEPAKKPGGINSLNASLNSAKAGSAINQTTINNYRYSFDQSEINRFPQGWNGVKNSQVKPFENNNWLALTRDGYWYPQQYNKDIKDRFSLSFDLAWNKDIAYNSGSFTVTLAEVDYDNTGERYRLDDNQNMYWSLYDSYVGKFNRVMLWFDPYWNGGGLLTVYSYDKTENIKVNKRITLPDFYLTKNVHQLKVQRAGQSLIITINNKKEAEIPDVFLPSVKYNLYTFSRYKGDNSDNKNDVFYLKNIVVDY
ncbi:MAG TPA: hypothetical protein PLU11_05575 [Chitinophagaceae bacterium]|nr:hypothetical protein [Chitinophagaceae bacterium]HPH31574.1 hypothetical protein [Chitinophagaceae bacterium]HPN58617.1 hypothetical protein [Chitinophagaceae bacterium]